MMKIGEETTVYIRALSNGVWFDAWAPVLVRLEWLREDGQVGLFTLTEEDLDEDDEYEFYEVGTLLIGKLEAGEFKAEAGVEA